MTDEEAKHFLCGHQPLPSDAALSRELIQGLDAVREHLLSNPDAECIPLLLGVFGPGSGFGVYQAIEEVLLKFDPELVLPHLCRGIRSEHEGVRFWNTQFAASFPSPCLIGPLAELLSCEDFDLKYAALTALEQIRSPRVREIAQQYLTRETEPELRAIALEIVQSK